MEMDLQTTQNNLVVVIMTDLKETLHDYIYLESINLVKQKVSGWLYASVLYLEKQVYEMLT